MLKNEIVRFQKKKNEYTAKTRATADRRTYELPRTTRTENVLVRDKNRRTVKLERAKRLTMYERAT